MANKVERRLLDCAESEGTNSESIMEILCFAYRDYEKNHGNKDFVLKINIQPSSLYSNLFETEYIYISMKEFVEHNNLRGESKFVFGDKVYKRTIEIPYHLNNPMKGNVADKKVDTIGDKIVCDSKEKYKMESEAIGDKRFLSVDIAKEVNAATKVKELIYTPCECKDEDQGESYYC